MSWPSSSRWTGASRSRSRATWTCRSRPRTSSTTPARPTSSTTPSTVVTPRARSAWPGRSSPGTSCRSWPPGRSRPALACGNTVVLKPAETTPLTALLLARIIEEAELPPGVVNIVTGAGEAGASLGERTPTSTRSLSPVSTEVGKRIQRALAGTEGRSASLSEPRRQGREHHLSLTRRSTRPSRVSSAASSSTKVTSAAPGRACSSKRACTTSSFAS